jgi:hypothetical protein
MCQLIYTLQDVARKTVSNFDTIVLWAQVIEYYTQYVTEPTESSSVTSAWFRVEGRVRYASDR